MLTRTFRTLQAPATRRTIASQSEPAGRRFAPVLSTKPLLRLSSDLPRQPNLYARLGGDEEFGVNVNFALVSQQRREMRPWLPQARLAPAFPSVRWLAVGRNG
jgi:hypothetical protein